MKAFKTALILTLVFFIPFGAALAIRGTPASVPVFAFQQKEKAAKSAVQPSESIADVSAADRTACAAALSSICGRTISEKVLAPLSDDALSALVQAAQKGALTPEAWHAACGFTLNTLLAKAEQTADGVWLIDKGDNGKDYFELGFVGDMNFTESGYVMPHASAKKNGVLDCIDETFRKEMQGVDVMLANNEFPYSTRGTPIPGKQYTFRANPESAPVLNQLGIDLVSLANNHAGDYGEEAFRDTLDTLRKNKMPYVGAGSNLAEASRPVCFLVNGYKVAYLAASRAEDLHLTPGATETTGGIFENYDSTALIQTIGQAAQQNDIVIVYVHWGIEYSFELSANQMRLAKEYIDAGAAAVIGSHPHVLQGMEFYKGAPIAYSLGNFWFNTRELDTGLLKLHFTGDKMTVQFVPGKQANSETRYLSSREEQRTLYDLLETCSPNKGIRVDDNGYVTAA